MKPAIIVVAYNRPKSLKRLLRFLGEAHYNVEDIPLVISIDKGDNQDVIEVANEFEWSHGRKEIIYQKENLKLRKHIIRCGDLSEKYGSVIILEDDLVVSRHFYQYAMSALDFSLDKKYIGGVSLYNHRWNVNVSEPFEIADDPYDNWYFQFASSWGEAWTAEQWKAFKQWYLENIDIDLHTDNMPEFVANWSSSSWLKYFIKYLIEKNKYFLYPKRSLTTNFSDAGTHVNNNNTNYQVPLQEYEIAYCFSKIEESSCIYDAFFENKKMASILGYNSTDFEMDLYGTKVKTNKRFVLSRRILNYKILTSFGCSMRPHENNIAYRVNGSDFFLYDTSCPSKNSNKRNLKRKLVYNHRYILLKDYKYLFANMLDTIAIGIKKRVKGRRK
ncbi:MAG: hypothetical protein ACLUPE_02885 [Turicibacter sanguinis]|uniref:hypothetical protein n=1 Tax=Turicibacter sanguinis TaxID=154288 RepID=UPI00399605CC